MTKSLTGIDGPLDALPDSDCFRGLVICPESTASRKNVATRIDGRGERRAGDRERGAGRKSMNFTAGIRKVALGALAVSSLFAGGNAASAFLLLTLIVAPGMIACSDSGTKPTA